MLVGTLRWTDETHVVFKVMGAGPDDPGLSLTKARDCLADHRGGGGGSTKSIPLTPLCGRTWGVGGG